MIIGTIRTIFHREAIAGAGPINQFFTQVALWDEASSAYKSGKRLSMEEAVFNMSLNRIGFQFSLVAEDAKKELYARTKSGNFEVDEYRISTDVCANFFFKDPRNFFKNNSQDSIRDDHHLSIKTASKINVEELISNNVNCQKVIRKAADMGMNAILRTTVNNKEGTTWGHLPETIRLSLFRQ